MRVTVRGVPLATLRRYRAWTRAPAALRDLGLVKTLEHDGHDVDDLGDLDLDVPEGDDGAGDGAVNAAFVRDALPRIRDDLDGRLGAADLDLLVGGGCTFAAASLDVAGRTLGGDGALVWLDAHGDYNTTASSPSGFVGGMALAMAVGRAPELLEGTGVDPRLSPDDVVHVGARALDGPEAEAFDETGIDVWDIDRIREVGAREAFDAVAGSVSDADWLAVHVDADVLDPSQMPAVDYPEPDGLRGDELAGLLSALTGTGKVRLLHLTAYNPHLDRLQSGRDLVARVAQGLEDGA